MKAGSEGYASASPEATSANFSEADNCPTAMPNGSTCQMYVYFVPTASGTLNGNLSTDGGAAISLAGVASVALAWACVHTVYTLRYARLYYSPPTGGIDPWWSRHRSISIRASSSGWLIITS